MCSVYETNTRCHNEITKQSSNSKWRQKTQRTNQRHVCVWCHATRITHSFIQSHIRIVVCIPKSMWTNNNREAARAMAVAIDQNQINSNHIYNTHMEAFEYAVCVRVCIGIIWCSQMVKSVRSDVWFDKMSNKKWKRKWLRTLLKLAITLCLWITWFSLSLKQQQQQQKPNEYTLANFVKQPNFAPPILYSA